MLNTKNQKITYISKVLLTFLFASSISLGVATNKVHAVANATDITQNITAGTLLTSIRDASNVDVVSPSLAMSSKVFSFSCYSAGSRSTGTLGSNTQRVYVDNPNATSNGWTLSVAGSATTALWTSGANTFDYNDAGGSGCTDGADTDTKGGQLTIDPSVGTVTTDCGSCTSTGVTKGSEFGFVEGTKDSITLVTASSSSDPIWRGYLTGAALKQSIPAEQPAVNGYTLNLVLTVVTP